MRNLNQDNITEDVVARLADTPDARTREIVTALVRHLHAFAREVKLTEANHFAAEMDHFAECVLSGKDPRTPGEEGLADVRVIAAIHEAAKAGRAVKIGRG